MPSRRSFLAWVKHAAVAASCARFAPARPNAASVLDPAGRIHIPIGIPDTLDTLKTFVEAEGNFSPGFGSYGIYFWLWDSGARRLLAPTNPEAAAGRGLHAGGLLIPWSRWRQDGLAAETSLCQVRLASPAGDILVVAARFRVVVEDGDPRRVAVYAALRPLGAAGWDVKRLEAAGGALLVDGHPALVAVETPSAAGVLPTDTIAALALQGEMPPLRKAESPSGDCSGALRFDVELPPGRPREFGFVCPVLPGRRAARHRWVDLGQNALVDTAELNPARGGIPQPDPGLGYFRSLRPSALFRRAETYWNRLLGGLVVELPDPRWGESLKAILAHVLMCLNEGAPDVAVVNYNVFNRDGVYIANILQKAGLEGFSRRILDYFLAHPFNGRAYPEADNPGQILWALHQHWRITRDRGWLERVYPKVRSIAAMIRYYRTTPGPHWVSPASLEFGRALPPSERRLLKPGRCDGYHPEYTEAFDVAGLRGAAELARELGSDEDAAAWSRLAEALFTAYDEKFGRRLPQGYGSYAVLWPCRLYPLDRGPGYEQFRTVGGQRPGGWRYFPLATAHQGLLAGNREAGCQTLEAHLEHEQMQGWYAFDEGGGSGSGGWHKVRTRWPHSKEKPGENLSVAMPHGWAIAEFWLLMRDCLVFEDRQRLVVLAGVPEDWLRPARAFRFHGLRTHFGTFGLASAPEAGGLRLEFTGRARPPAGFALRLPPAIAAATLPDGRKLRRQPNGDFLVPPGATRVSLRYRAD